MVGKGIDDREAISCSRDGMEKTIEMQDVDFRGLCFVNLVDFLGKDKMLQLLKNYPELKQAYLKDDSQEAKHTFKYLLELRNKQKK